MYLLTQIVRRLMGRTSSSFIVPAEYSPASESPTRTQSANGIRMPPKPPMTH